MRESPVERTPPPLSHPASPTRRFRCRGKAALVLLLGLGLPRPAAALSSGPAAALSSGSDPLGPELRRVENALRADCGCDSLRVVWKISPELSREARQLDSLSACLEDPPAASASGLRRIAVHLRGRNHGRRIDLLLGGEPACFDTLLTATRAIHAGETLGPGDLRQTAGWFSLSSRRAERNPPPEPFALSTLARGDPVRQGDLTTVPAVRKGEALRMVYHAAGFTLSGPGIARENAWPGEITHVRLVGATRDCQAKVLGPGLVEIGEEAAERAAG